MATLTTTISYGEPAGSMVATLGAPGPAGQAATVTVGSTVTGAAGTPAAVVNVGTSSAAVLDFTIPQGIKGDQGNQGAPGTPGTPGTAATVAAGSTSTGAPGTSASVVNAGTSSAAVFNFTIPRGDVGAQGTPGTPGTPGVVAATAPLAYDSGTQTVSISSTPIFAAVYAYNGTEEISISPISLTATNATSSLGIDATGITFPDATFQGTAYPGTGTFLPLAGGALNANASATASDTSTATDSEFAGWGIGVQLSADHTKGTTVEFDGVDAYDGLSHMQVTPAGLTFPDASVQTTAFTGSSSAAWGSITGTLSSQTDLQNALDAKYDASNPSGFITQGTADGLYYSISNPSGFITSGDLAGYATESFVTSQGYITASALTGYATESWVQSQGYLYPDANGVIQYPNGVMTDPSFPIGRFWYQSQKFRWTDGVAIRTVASESYVTTALGSYAPLAGATFTGKITGATISVSTPSVNLGGQCDSAPASATNGDLWISNATAPKLTYRMGGVNYNLPVLNQFNTFTNQMVIDTSSATTAALRVTQRGAGNAIEVEDSTTPDATKFVVDQFGKVGVGTAPDATAAIKIDGTGMSFNGLVFNPTATSAHTGGSDTLDLLVTINGTNYRLGLRPA